MAGLEGPRKPKGRLMLNHEPTPKKNTIHSIASALIPSQRGPQSLDCFGIVAGAALQAGADHPLVMAWRRTWEPSWPFGAEEGHPTIGGAA